MFFKLYFIGAIAFPHTSPKLGVYSETVVKSILVVTVRRMYLVFRQAVLATQYIVRFFLDACSKRM